MPTIALDAMGGDHAPDAIVRGAALVSTTTDIETLLVGNPDRLQAILDHVPYNPEHLAIVPAVDVVGMGDDPREALKTKKDASLFVAIRAAAEGRADAVVSGRGRSDEGGFSGRFGVSANARMLHLVRPKLLSAGCHVHDPVGCQCLM